MAFFSPSSKLVLYAFQHRIHGVLRERICFQVCSSWGAEPREDVGPGARWALCSVRSVGVGQGILGNQLWQSLLRIGLQLSSLPFDAVTRLCRLRSPAQLEGQLTYRRPSSWLDLEHFVANTSKCRRLRHLSGPRCYRRVRMLHMMWTNTLSKLFPVLKGRRGSLDILAHRGESKARKSVRRSMSLLRSHEPQAAIYAV